MRIYFANILCNKCFTPLILVEQSSSSFLEKDTWEVNFEITELLFLFSSHT